MSSLFTSIRMGCANVLSQIAPLDLISPRKTCTARREQQDTKLRMYSWCRLPPCRVAPIFCPCLPLVLPIKTLQQNRSSIEASNCADCWLENKSIAVLRWCSKTSHNYSELVQAAKAGESRRLQLVVRRGKVLVAGQLAVEHLVTGLPRPLLLELRCHRPSRSPPQASETARLS